MTFVYLDLVLFVFAVGNWPCKKTGIQEQGRHFRVREKWLNCHIPGNFILNLFPVDKKNITQFSEFILNYSKHKIKC